MNDRTKDIHLYWGDRKERDDNAYRKAEDELIRELQKQYKTTLKEIKAELGQFYLDYAIENKVSLQEAQKLLTGRQLQELRKSMADISQAYKEGKITDRDYSAKLNALQSRLRVQRIEALKFNIESKVFNLHSTYNKKAESFLYDVYKLADKNTKKNIIDMVGDNKVQRFGKKFFNTPSDRLIKDIANNPWSGANFSERIWTDKRKLVEALERNITTGFIQGNSYNQTAQALAKELETSFSNAKRLVRTESKYITTQSEFNVYAEVGVEEYEYTAALDSRTSRICRDFDGETIIMKDAVAGVNLPPMHPYCRSFIIPVFKDIDKVAGMEYNKSEGKNTEPETVKEAKNKFVPAENIKEATKYAKDELKIPNADFKDMSLEFANCMNRVLKESYEEFPEMIGEIKFIGTSQRRNKLYADNVLVPDVRKQLEKMCIKQGFDLKSPNIQSEIEKLVKRERRSFMAKHRIKANVNASATPSEWKQYQGITFNKNRIKDIKEFNKVKKYAVDVGWSATGTGHARGTMYHEFGHQLEFYLKKHEKGKEALKKIRKIYTEKGENYIKKELSEYGADTYHEFIAEAWAEYKLNPNCRKLAKEISEIITEAMKVIKKG